MVARNMASIKRSLLPLIRPAFLTSSISSLIEIQYQSHTNVTLQTRRILFVRWGRPDVFDASEHNSRPTPTVHWVYYINISQLILLSK